MRAEQWIRLAVALGAVLIALTVISSLLLRLSAFSSGPDDADPVIVSTTVSPGADVVVEILSNNTAAVRTGTNDLIGIVRGHGDTVVAAEFLPDGRLLTIDSGGTRILTDIAHLRLREAVHSADIADNVSSFLWRNVLEVPTETVMALNARYSPLSPGSDRFDPSISAPVLSVGFEPFVGTIFRDCDDCPELVVTPAGTYQYGSPIDDPNRLENEQFRSIASVELPLAVGRFEVSVREYQQFVDETGYLVGGNCRVDADGNGSPAVEPDATFRTPGYEQTDAHPVVCVSWNDAQQYVDWLSEKTGHTYRLLSGIEWEFVARAGTQSPYWWGNEPSRRFANFGADMCCKGFAEGADQWLNTSPRGAFPPNAFGVFEAQGNAYEWIEDCFRAPTEALPPALREGELCENRTARGGSWSDNSQFLRVSARFGTPATARHHDVGFRIARTLRD